MYGLVIYAGHDTKLVQNSGELEQAGWLSHFKLCLLSRISRKDKVQEDETRSPYEQDGHYGRRGMTLIRVETSRLYNSGIILDIDTSRNHYSAHQ